MELLNQKLKALKEKHESNERIKIAILGLGSVGNYLLSYLLSKFEDVEIIVVGRSEQKMLPDVNIARVAAGIRHNHYNKIKIVKADFNNIDQLADVFSTERPDFIVNSSRVYSHLKYGSISWNSIRAYGIWSPLSVGYIKRIMEGLRISNEPSIVINTSYSDATNAWLKTGGYKYPDFGSGNLNHLIPRIKLAVAQNYNISDVENIDVTICTSHFHDVLISKEGITEGVDPLLQITYRNNVLDVDPQKIYSCCTIAMPTDEKRNMMNASSNFEIIAKIVDSIRQKAKAKIHSPGFCGKVGGYPVEVDFSPEAESNIKMFDQFFSLGQMETVNQKSIYLDGIESIDNGILTYTDELLDKTYRKLGYQLPKTVNITDSDSVAGEIINNIIAKQQK